MNKFELLAQQTEDVNIFNLRQKNWQSSSITQFLLSGFSTPFRLVRDST